MNQLLTLLREAWISVLSQAVYSWVSGFITAGMCISVILTMGRVVGTEQAVLSTIDERGTRSIVVRAEPDAGMHATVLDRIGTIEGVEWAGAFGDAQDARNGALSGGVVVPVRSAYSLNYGYLGVPDRLAVPDRSVMASPSALRHLGMSDESGTVRLVADGTDYAVVGKLAAPDFLDFMEPLLILPQEPNSIDKHHAVGILVIVVTSPNLVAPTSEIVATMLDVTDSTKIKVETSKEFAALRASISGQLSGYGSSLVMGVFALSGVLVAGTWYGLVLLRRKDFGRRRALGATRGFIVCLLLAQSGIVGVIGGTIGCFASWILLFSIGDPQPPGHFYASVAILAVANAILAALAPAVAASRRDPIRELRVP